VLIAGQFVNRIRQIRLKWMVHVLPMEDNWITNRLNSWQLCCKWDERSERWTERKRKTENLPQHREKSDGSCWQYHWLQHQQQPGITWIHLCEKLELQTLTVDFDTCHK